MKTCACCGALAIADAAVCSQCGEQSWQETRDTEPAPAADDAAPSKKRGR